MELFFLAVLIVTMAAALGSGFPVAFALPGAAIVSIVLAAGSGYLFAGGNVDAFFHSGGPSQWLAAGVTNLRGVYWEVERDTLIAIPLFIFMGIMLQRSKIAEDLLVTMARLFGTVPGGLGISVVFVGALLAATTGIVGATVVAMGLISLPAMLRNRYSPSLATGTIAASGTLGQIIPPSIVLIILADQLAGASDQASTARKALHKDATGELTMPSIFDVTSTSAGEMFLGAFVPGIVLVLLYMLFILVLALIRPKLAPPVPYDGAMDVRFWGNVILSVVPPLTLIFLVLGSIISGIATVNQAGAIGAAGALMMAGYRLVDAGKTTFYPAILALVGLAVIAFAQSSYNLNVKSVIALGDSTTGLWLGGFGVSLVLAGLIWSGIRVLRIENTLREVMMETAKTTSLVFIILLGAAMLTASFRAFGGEELVKEFLTSLPGGFWTQFVIVMAVIFVLGFFLDFIEIAVVVVPIVAPILLADPQANITAVWLGVMIGLNIQTSFLTPPFGFALFYLRGVAPAAVKTVQIYKGVIAFICLQLVALGIVGYFPQLVNYLPNRASLLGETAPPPRNPKLQQCLEEYVRQRLDTDRSQVGAAIAEARALDLSALPKNMASDLGGAFESAENALSQIDVVFATHETVEKAAPEYRPQLNLVRGLERRILKLEKEAGDLNRRAGYLSAETDSDRRMALEEEAAELLRERDRIAAGIPSGWNDIYDRFSALVSAEDKARRTYRRAGDEAHDAPADFLAVINANGAYFGLKDSLSALEEVIVNGERQLAENAVNETAKSFAAVPGSNDVRSALSKAKRYLREGREDREKALKEWVRAVDEYHAQSGWRRAAEGKLRDGVQAYLAAIAETVGSRQQDRLSRAQALYVAGCNAVHQDLSLHF